MLNFDIQNHKPLREMVYDELKMQILTGAIVPGTRMMEVELAEQMGVSRTPIREAIRKLEKEGLVTIEPRRGAYASMISADDMVEVLVVRQNLEGLAAYLAATNMSEEQISELKTIAKNYVDAIDRGATDEMISYDTMFHRCIVEACENKVLLKMIEQLQELVLRFRYIYYDNYARVEKMPSEHKLILEGIESRDSEKAREASMTHIEGMINMFIEGNMIPENE